MFSMNVNRVVHFISKTIRTPSAWVGADHASRVVKPVFHSALLAVIKLKNLTSQRHQVFSHLEQSLGNTGCFREVMTHSQQVEEAFCMEGVHPRGLQARIPADLGEDS